MRSFSILLLGLLFTACATPRTPAPEAVTRNASIVQRKLTATYRSITLTADDIAARRVPVAQLPRLLTKMCHDQCEATHLRCLSNAYGITSHELNQRPPRNFPIDIPECSDPDCSREAVPEPPGSGCDTARDACNRRCDCAALP